MHNNKCMYEIHENNKHGFLDRRNHCVDNHPDNHLHKCPQCRYEQVHCYAAVHNTEYTTTIAISRAD